VKTVYLPVSLHSLGGYNDDGPVDVLDEERATLKGTVFLTSGVYVFSG